MNGVELNFDATRECAFVILEVNHRSEEARLEMFERLTLYKDTLEMDFPEGLTGTFVSCAIPESRWPVFIQPNPGLTSTAVRIGESFSLLWLVKCICWNETSCP